MSLSEADEVTEGLDGPHLVRRAGFGSTHAATVGAEVRLPLFSSSPLWLVTSPLSMLLWLLPLSEESGYTSSCHMSEMRLKSQAAGTGACRYHPSEVALIHCSKGPYRVVGQAGPNSYRLQRLQFCQSLG